MVVYTVANAANYIVDGRTVTVFTTYQSGLRGRSDPEVRGRGTAANKSIIISNNTRCIPRGVDGIIFDYALDLDFGGLIKKLR